MSSTLTRWELGGDGMSVRVRPVNSAKRALKMPTAVAENVPVLHVTMLDGMMKLGELHL